MGRTIAGGATAAIHEEFDESMSPAFELHAVGQQAADEVAQTLGITPIAVYIAKGGTVQPEPPRANLAPGYRIIGEIHRDGHGVVYTAMPLSTTAHGL